MKYLVLACLLFKSINVFAWENSTRVYCESSGGWDLVIEDHSLNHGSWGGPVTMRVVSSASARINERSEVLYFSRVCKTCSVSDGYIEHKSYYSLSLVTGCNELTVGSMNPQNGVWKYKNVKNTEQWLEIGGARCRVNQIYY